MKEGKVSPLVIRPIWCRGQSTASLRTRQGMLDAPILQILGTSKVRSAIPVRRLRGRCGTATLRPPVLLQGQWHPERHHPRPPSRRACSRSCAFCSRVNRIFILTLQNAYFSHRISHAREFFRRPGFPDEREGAACADWLWLSKITGAMVFNLPRLAELHSRDAGASTGESESGLSVRECPILNHDESSHVFM